MGRLEQLVGADGFAVGGKLSLADLLLYKTFGETLDIKDAKDPALPAHRREPFASFARTTKALNKHPRLKACVASVAAHKGVKKWLAMRGKQGF